MILIIGAGISGLTLAHHLKKEFLILEQADQVGGLCSQYHSEGYYFDYGGHYFHFKDSPQVKDYISEFHPLNKYNRSSEVFIFNRFIPFPIQYHLSYLPDPIKETVYQELLSNKGLKKTNLSEYLYSIFGETLFKIFFQPFMDKYYQRNLSDLAFGFDKGSIPIPQRDEVKKGYQGKTFKNTGYNPLFYYPKGEMRGFMTNYSAAINPHIKLNEKVLKIDLINKKVHTTKSSYSYTTLVNTMPLSILIKSLIQDDFNKSQESLWATSTQVVNFVLEKRRRAYHWIYLPQKKELFYRAGYYPGNKEIKGYLERSLSSTDHQSEQDSSQAATKTLITLGMIKDSSEILTLNSKTIPISYIIFNHQWKKVVPTLLKELNEYHLFSIGRYGRWRYSSMAEDIKTAILTAEMINQDER